jgi:hypothetical protein
VRKKPDLTCAAVGRDIVQGKLEAKLPNNTRPAALPPHVIEAWLATEQMRTE